MSYIIHGNLFLLLQSNYSLSLYYIIFLFVLESKKDFFFFFKNLKVNPKILRINHILQLKNVEYNGKKIFNEDIENEEVLQKCGITNKNCEDKQPDLLLFPKLGSVVIIDFKKPNEKCFDYEKQVRDYAKLMYSKTNEEFNNLKHFYCYIIGETYGVPDDHYKETPDLEGYFAFQPIKDFNNKKPDLTIYEEITKFSRIQKLADLRNQPFIDKLGIKENIEKVVAEIFNDKEKQD